MFVNLRHPSGWALALAAAPLSARDFAPQLGTRRGDLPQETGAYVADAPTEETQTFQQRRGDHRMAHGR